MSTPYGDGYAWAVIDYGQEHHLLFVVTIDSTGEIRTVANPDVRVRPNETMRAPRVIAKGADLVAAKIRELGMQHNVPVLEAPALARAIFRHADINDEIPGQLYTAVAEVLADGRAQAAGIFGRNGDDELVEALVHGLVS